MKKIYFGNELYHYGVQGQKWGVRRYQNSDGSLTEEGKKRYSRKNSKNSNNGINHKEGAKYWNDKNVDEYAALQKYIEKNLGDWYFNTYVDKDFGEKLNNLRKANRESWHLPSKESWKRVEKAREELASVALNKMGYPDTNENRDWILPVIIWD